jgi:hypothetical protein
MRNMSETHLAIFDPPEDVYAASTTKRLDSEADTASGIRRGLRADGSPPTPT